MRTQAALAVLLATAAFTACGDAEDSDGTRAADGTKLVSTIYSDYVDPPGLDDAGRIEEALNDIQADFAIEEGSGVCRELAGPAERWLEQTGIVPGGGCDEVVTELARRSRVERVKRRFSTVLDVDIKGNRAIAHVQERGGDPHDVPFILERGDWELVDLNDAEPIKELIDR